MNGLRLFHRLVSSQTLNLDVAIPSKRPCQRRGAVVEILYPLNIIEAPTKINEYEVINAGIRHKPFRVSTPYSNIDGIGWDLGLPNRGTLTRNSEKIFGLSSIYRTKCPGRYGTNGASLGTQGTWASGHGIGYIILLPFTRKYRAQKRGNDVYEHIPCVLGLFTQ